ncbi:serine/threonine-protein kinase [Streptomyces clavuligerus]|uniref:serine/threonine-protein kinase n=1 Tax=Streptomyces clavuligerus TaxID=1901 RepID=UPI00020D91E3|nr:serine/threonine-protein kinase [Streptomyces clavuligerus]ANW18565.1 serine/threonine protein kinase [Streptomyces clavuligerus]AXU13126.1 serine/threonine protein kinase [Streptomyces clavuligerus]MBY6303068.1 protein kinase [Streptomyces clavuligerus]QCS05909.1 serine/threonine protein kinase [Streptomyces clavuligerus]QPJ94726.1 protein kinase [Streptomyces clavuligerus]
MENSQRTGTGQLLAGRYRLGESIGRGGMGRVWRAEDEMLNRAVAIKELTAGMYASEADRRILHVRTRNEARAAARISHPCVVTVHDVLVHDDRPWIVMQFVDGRSLADAAKESGRVPVADAARIGLQVLRGLNAAHRAGVLHRDVKPANILLAEDGGTLITDFGIAAIEGDATITRTGEIVGSIDYLAPERVKGGDPGPASDLWSLGATLYTAMEGVSPFRRQSPVTTMQAVVTEEPKPPEHSGPLTPVIMALLSKDPAARPSAAQAEEMFRAVTEGRSPDLSVLPDTVTLVPGGAPVSRDTTRSVTLVGGGTPVAPPAAVPPPRRSGGLGRVIAAVAVVLATLVGLGVGYVYLQDGDGGSGQGAGGPGAGERTQGTAPSDGGADGTGDKAGGKGRNQGQGEADGGDGPGDRASGGTGGVPAGWRRVQDPAGFSLLVPQGWTRRMVGQQIDYSPADRSHRLRIGIDRSPDFETPYEHLLDLEKLLSKSLPDYRRLSLGPTVYRDQPKSARWEFAWTEKKPFPGPRRAIDQMYYDDEGVEYAFYLDGPADRWSTVRAQFQTMTQSWRPPGPSD